MLWILKAIVKRKIKNIYWKNGIPKKTTHTHPKPYCTPAAYPFGGNAKKDIPGKPSLKAGL